jgi:hypothetical protein
VEQTPTQHLYNGFGNALARGFELVVTPTLFALIGHFIDHRMHTRIVFTVSLLLFALIGMSVRMYFGYVEEMKAHEAKGPWARAARGKEAP